MTDINQKTIDDFDEQWTHYSDNEGWYGSLELFQDMTSPLFDVGKLEGKSVVDIGSGTGRIVEDANGTLRNLNIKGLAAFDLRARKEDGSPWDFSKSSDFKEAVQYIKSIGQRGS